VGGGGEEHSDGHNKKRSSTPSILLDYVSVLCFGLSRHSKHKKFKHIPFLSSLFQESKYDLNVCCSNIVNNSEDGELLSMMEYLASTRTAPAAAALFYYCGRRRQRAS